MVGLHAKSELAPSLSFPLSFFLCGPFTPLCVRISLASAMKVVVVFVSETAEAEKHKRGRETGFKFHAPPGSVDGIFLLS